MSTLKQKNRITKENFKALQVIQIGQPKSLVAEKYGKPQNTNLSMFSTKKSKEKIMTTFSSGLIHLKREDMKLGKYDDLDKAVLVRLSSSGL